MMLNEIEIRIIYKQVINDMNKFLDTDVIDVFDVNLLIEDINENDKNRFKTLGYYVHEYESNYDEDNLINEELDGKKVITVDKESCINEDITYNLIAHEFCHYLCDRIVNRYNSSFCTDTSPMFCLIVRWFNNNGFDIEMNSNYDKLFGKYQKILCKLVEESNDKYWKILKHYIEDMCKIINYNEFLSSCTICKTVEEMINTKSITVHFNGDKSKSIAKVDNNWVHIRLGLDIDFANYNDYINKIIENAKSYKRINEWNF